MINAQDLEVIVVNTTAVLTTLGEKKAEWREVIADAWQRAGERGAQPERAFLEAVLGKLDGGPGMYLPLDNPYREAFERIEAMIREGGMQAPPLPAETLEALNQLLTSETWAQARQVLEQHSGILLDPKVEEALDQLAEGAVNDGKPELAENFAMHRDLLRLCRARGIEAAFEDFGLQEEADRVDLVEAAVRGLSGSQAERMTFAQYVAQRLEVENDPAERSLMETLQMAVFSRHPAAVKHNLQGEQAEVWEQIRKGLGSRES